MRFSRNIAVFSFILYLYREASCKQNNLLPFPITDQKVDISFKLKWRKFQDKKEKDHVKEKEKYDKKK